MRSFDRAAFIAVLASVFACAAAVRAQSVAVDASSCEADLASAVPPALDVELSSASDDARRAIANGEVRGDLACTSDDVLVHVTRGGEQLTEHVTTAGPALPRRIAMVLAELIDAITTPAPPHVEPTPALPEPTPEPVHVDALRARLRVAGGAWIGGAPLLPLGSVELGVELDPTENVAVVGAISGAFGGASTRDAHIDVRLISAALSLRLGGWLDVLWLGGGPAARGGLVSFSGAPLDPRSATGSDALAGWLGLGAVVAAIVRVPDSPLRIGVELEGGGIAVGANAIVFDAVAQRIGDGWLDARLVIDIVLDGANS